jgi:hypothetical protein
MARRGVGRSAPARFRVPFSVRSVLSSEELLDCSGSAVCSRPRRAHNRARYRTVHATHTRATSSARRTQDTCDAQRRPPTPRARAHTLRDIRAVEVREDGTRLQRGASTRASRRYLHVCISGLRVALVPALSAARPAHTHTPAAETDASSCARPRIRRLAASQPYSLRARELGRERQERRSARCWRFRIRTHPTSLRIPCLRQGA